jgi:V/A-type H+/Na+-transporting ATPase subunit A
MLEVTLGPGLLSKNFDGLQNDLDKMTGIFLKRGEYTEALEKIKITILSPSQKKRQSKSRRLAGSGKRKLD